MEPEFLLRNSSPLAYNNGIRSGAMHSIFTVAIHAADEGGYWAECRELQGCFTQGETLQETELNMYEAIDLFIEDVPDIKEYSLAFEVV